MTLYCFLLYLYTHNRLWHRFSVWQYLLNELVKPLSIKIFDKCPLCDSASMPNTLTDPNKIENCLQQSLKSHCLVRDENIKKKIFFKGLGNDWVLTELQISKNSEEGKIIKFRQEGLYKVGEWPNRYFEVEGEEPNRDKRCQPWSAIPNSYYETDQGPKLDRQGCSLNVETHFLTFQSPRFSVLRVNCKNFFSNESLSVHSFIRSLSQVIHWTFIVYSVLCIYHLYGMTFWSF